MELKEAIRGRRSIRSFGKGKVSEEVILELIELGNLAPSAGNLQARDFVVVENEETRHELARAALGQRFIAEAPVVIVVCANLRRIGPYGARGVSLYCIQDSAASIQNILLAVHEKGLGCVWVGAFNEAEVARILGLPEHIRPVALLPIGEPLERPEGPERIPVERLVHYEKW